MAKGFPSFLQLCVPGLELLLLICDTLEEQARGYTKSLYRTLIDRFADTKQQVCAFMCANGSGHCFCETKARNCIVAVAFVFFGQIFQVIFCYLSPIIHLIVGARA